MQSLASRPLWICLLVALILRLGFVFVGFPVLQPRWNLREDGDGYGAIAATIRAGHYSDVTRGPVFPAFVALAGSALMAKFLQAVLDTATVWLVFLLAHRDWRAAALWAVYPFAIWRTAFLNKETLLTFCLVAYVCVQLLAAREKRLWQWVVAGVLLGVVNLCKPTFLAWPLVVMALAFLHRVNVRQATLMLVAMLLVVCLWTMRNYRLTGAILPVATEQGGVTTFIGNYQPTLGLWEGPGKEKWMLAVAQIRSQHVGASALELDRVFYAAAFAEITRNPVRAAELFGRKCGRFWFLSAARREQAITFIVQIFYLGLGVAGLSRRWPWRFDTVLILALVLYVMLIHALSYADMRFSLPVMPLICVLAWRSQVTPRSTAATAPAAV